MWSIRTLVPYLYKCKDAYYNGEPEIPDSEFDALEDVLGKLEAKDADEEKMRSDYSKYVGAKPKKKGVVIKHLTKMLSLGKVKSIVEYRGWVAKRGLPINIPTVKEPKMDGIAGVLRYNQNKLLYAATRGDGEEGTRIEQPETIAGVPMNIKWPYGVSFGIRGEFFIPKRYAKELNNAPLRNLCNGILTSPDERRKYVHFAAYHIDVETDDSDWFPTEVSMLQYLEKICPIVVPWEIVQFGTPNDPETAYRLYLSKHRNEWAYETDGMVFTVNDRKLQKEIDKQYVTDHHHAYHVAFKPPSEFAVTKLLDIAREVSRLGRINPRAVLEPVQIGSVSVSSATLEDEQNILSLDLHQGDLVRVERSGDVIPNIIVVEKRGEGNKFTTPKKCPACGSPTRLDEGGIYLFCTNANCPERVQNTILYWLKESGAKNIGPAVIRDLYNAEAIKSLPDLYRIDVKSILSVVPGYTAGGPKIATIEEEIERTRRMTEQEMLSRIGIPGVGLKMLQFLKVSTVDDLYDIKFAPSREYKAQENIVSWLNDPANVKLIEEMQKVLVIEKAVKEREFILTTQAGRKLCITGSFPETKAGIEEQVEALGYQVVSAVSKDTFALLAFDPSSNSVKMQKALQFGVRIVYSVEELKKL